MVHIDGFNCGKHRHISLSKVSISPRVSNCGKRLMNVMEALLWMTWKRRTYAA